MSDASEFVADLVAECITRREGEGDAAVDAVCDAHPQHADAIRKRLRRLADMGLLTEPEESAPSLHALPERIGDYKLLRRLGEGGMGVVHLAEQQRLGRRVALKLVRPEQLWFPGARERFAREAELVAALTHPGIVPLYEVGEENGLPWLSMEFVEGASLEDVIRAFKGRDPSTLSGADLERVVRERAGVTENADVQDATPSVTPDAAGAATASSASRSSVSRSAVGAGARESALFGDTWVRAALRIAHTVAEALAYAHAQGVLHRDIKASNVILGVDGRVRLLDFGLAVRDGSTRLTVTGQLLGSLAYMPAERLRSENASRDPRSDVYSLGATLFELLTLRTPFVAESTESLRRQILETRAPSPRTWNRALDRDTEAVCAVALDPDPARRYASAEAFAADLQRLLKSEPVLARPPSLAHRATTWAKRRPAVAAALVLAGLLIVGVPTGYALVTANHADELRDEVTETAAQRDRAEANLTLANTERARAEGNLDLAREAVDTLLVEVSNEVLDRAPGMTELRRSLRENALEFYAAILEQRADSRELVLRRLDIVRNMATTLNLVGRLDESRQDFEELAATVRELLASGPPDGGEWSAAERDELARFEYMGAFGRVDPNKLMHGDEQERDAQLAWLLRALEIARTRVAHSADPLARFDLANTLLVLADWDNPLAEVDAAAPRFHQAFELLEDITDTASADLDPDLALARRMEAVFSFSRHLWQRSLAREVGEDAYVDVIRYGAAVQRDLQARYDSDSIPLDLRQERAFLLSGMARTLKALKQTRESEQLYDFAIADLEAVIAVEGDEHLLMTTLASQVHDLAVLIEADGRRYSALDLLRPMLPRMLDAHARWPEVEELRSATALIAARLGWMQIHTDLLDEARVSLTHLLVILEESSSFRLANGHPLIDHTLGLWETAERDAGDDEVVARIVAARAHERAFTTR
ncbi:MAG: hypothetical protein DHS20C15_19110 [Planctomycetota bacterium]|nr:MAG: hypothetical protein DHS20C15_19110 [Planctomycetota bacterium]